ncbi:hypothetical protein CYMTET_47725 [Cymbomonas tetramitiformis]|uniref:Uncharacterized protein n=1 Tax=Cymbomonas tetramitiformis TaxID=36881 RepID=A0AAE0BTL8_9CHLO|nr:hypothetical protein CYMTET_47725 [Cymbomonas tetramitiformis]|eukprot:gene4525-5541_t
MNDVENELPLPSTPRIAEMQNRMNVGVIAPMFMSSASVRVILALTEEVSLNMMHPVQEGKTLADLLCYSKEDVGDMDVCTEGAARIKELADDIGTVDPEDDIASWSEQEVVFLTISEEILDTFVDTKLLANNAARRYYLYCVFQSFHDSAVRSILNFEHALREAASFEARPNPSRAELEAYAGKLQNESDAHELAVSDYYLRHRTLLEWCGTGVLYQRPDWLVGMPEPTNYDHVDYFIRVEKGGVFSRLRDRFRFGNREFLIKTLWRS